MKSAILAFLFLGFSVFGQENDFNELTYNEYLGYVKKYHPLVKNANLEISRAQANLMMASGGFDPTVKAQTHLGRAARHNEPRGRKGKNRGFHGLFKGTKSHNPNSFINDNY